MVRKLTAALLPYIEDSFASAYAGHTTPVVAVIGPPRSGTTLLYQSMVHAWRWSYFSTAADLARFLAENGIVVQDRWTLPANFQQPLPKPLPQPFECELVMSTT